MPRHPARTLGLVLGLTLASVPARAQDPPPAGAGVPRAYPINVETAPRPVARAVRSPRHLVIDARLDEPEWRLAEPLTDFVQQLPETGQLARFRTVTRVLYDSSHIYIAAENFDPEPRRAITVGLERDFVSTNSDIFAVAFDTFLDRRNSFLFIVNPHGALRDEQTFNDSRNIVEAWEGVIDLKTAFTDSSWVVEMRVPLKTLRFDVTRPVQDWGINFVRRVRRINETSYWAPLDRQHRVHRMSRAGTLAGLEGLRQGRNLQLKPAMVAGNSSGAQVPASALGSRFDAGVDFKVGLSPSLTLDATVNTDFSQVEVDQLQVNLTRFSLFFSERREFFIENAGVFTFGDVRERNVRTGASLSDFTFFNSRQIGLSPDGRPIPILGGVRLTGRIGGLDAGLLEMQTEGALGRPAENFAVVRLKRNLFGSSDIGVLLANRQATEGPAAWSRSYGVDANLRPTESLVINSYLALNDALGQDADGLAARTSVAYRDALWNTSVLWKRVSEDFDPGIGFVRRRAMQQWYGTVGLHTRPPLSWLSELNPYVEGSYITNLSSRLDTRVVTAALDVFFRPDGELQLEVSDEFDRLTEPFTVAAGHTIPAGGYGFRRAGIRYVAGTGRALSGNVGISTGGFYHGDRTTWNAGLTWRASYRLRLEGTAQRNAVSLPSGDFTADLLGGRVRYAWSPRLFGSAYVQYNTQTRSFVTNARLSYRWAPLSDIFLVYTERQDTDLDVRNERSVAIKVTRMIGF
jgi:hypothetical protein